MSEKAKPAATSSLPPPELEKAPAGPGFYSGDLKEFVLTYDDVRNSASPRDTLFQFLQTTYEAGADLARWDRAALERKPQPDGARGSSSSGD